MALAAGGAVAHCTSPDAQRTCPLHAHSAHSTLHCPRDLPAASCSLPEGLSILPAPPPSCLPQSPPQLLAAVEVALALVRSGKADLNAPAPDGSTPTLLAVRHCPVVALVTALVAGGADVAARNKAGEAPLLLALTLAGERGTSACQ